MGNIFHKQELPVNLRDLYLVEEREGRLWGYEFKWGKKRPKIPKAWLETYENAQFECINKENFLDFIT